MIKQIFCKRYKRNNVPIYAKLEHVMLKMENISLVQDLHDFFGNMYTLNIHVKG